MNETVKFQRMVKRLVAQSESKDGLAGGITLTSESPELIRITKKSVLSDGFEFSMLVRIKQDNSKTVWLPIEYSGRDGELIKCETTINGKTLVNMSKQSTLNDLAETWARSLEAQTVVKTIDNALR